MTITDTDHIREIIASCKAKTLPLQASRDFAAYLEKLPYLPLRLDWSKIPNRSSIAWNLKSDQEVVEWARSLRIGKYSHVALWYSSNEPCLITAFDFGVSNLDTLTWNAPGPRYLFGVDVKDGTYQYSFDAFLETTGGDLLHGVV